MAARGIAPRRRRPASAGLAPPRTVAARRAIVLAAACLAVFGRSVGHGLLFWDDRAFIAENPLIAHPSPRGMIGLWTRPLLSLYAPLTYTLWAAVSAVAGVRPWAFHLTNVVLHWLAACAVGALLARLVGPGGGAAALAGALLFAVHPLQTEAVAWASETKDILAAVCSFVAMRQYLVFRERGGGAAYLAAFAIFVCALLAKPSAIVVPALLVVVARAVEHRSWRDTVRGLVPWFVVAAAWAVLAARVQPAAERLRYPTPPWLRPVVALDTLGFYLGKLIFPVGLAPDYGRTSAWLVSTGAWHLAWIPAAAVLVAAWVVRGRAPAITVAVALFAVALVPVLGFVPFDFQAYSNVADHYVYLAMLGPAAGLALAYPAIPSIGRRLGVPLLIGALGVLSFAQSARWRDDLALYGHTLSVNPASVMAINNTGQVLEERGLLEPALAEYRRALEVDPLDQGALNNVGNVLFKLGRYDDAIRHYTDVLRRAGGRTDTVARMHNNLGAAYLKTARWDEAVAEFRQAIAIDPDYLEPYYNLGIVLMAFGRRAEAAEAFRRGLAIDPGHAGLRAQLAAAEPGTR